MKERSLPRGLAQAGALASCVLTAHTVLNLRRIRRPTGTDARPTRERVSVLLPARNEAHRIRATIESVLAQELVADLEILVLDDGSTDGTAELVHEVAGHDARVKVLDGDDNEPPPGWRGKPWACHRLALEATGTALVFIDADVVLHPRAVAAAVGLMRSLDMQLVSPYPRQLAVTPLERISQPLVTWSWMATLPMPLAERSWAAWSATIGQFIAVDAAAYHGSGGHAAVASYVVEDVEVLRALKRHGHRGIPVDGSAIADCRMYDGAREVYEGYTKSLWAVWGTPLGAAGGAATMLLIYVVPSLVALASRDASARRWGALGYASAVAGRAVVARQTGERMLPDVLAQPVSLAAFAFFSIASVVRHRRGSLRWKGRPI